MSEEVYRDEDFPHGLRCANDGCNHLFEQGERIMQIPAGAVDEVRAGIPRYKDFETEAGPMDTQDIPVVLLVCEPCAREP